MDPGTLIGIVIALVCIIVSMILEGGNPMSIMLVPPLLLVFGGTFGAAMAGGPLKDTTGLVRWVKKALLAPMPNVNELIAVMVTLAERARREGLLAMEEAAKDIEDPFLKKGLELAVDGTDPEQVRELLEIELDAKKADDKAGAKFFEAMGGYAPTVGIIGTVLGLIHVLENLNEPDKLGHLIAAAFVATLWGVLSANVFWLPMAAKLKRLSELENQNMNLLIEGITSIQAGANPRLVEMKLLACLPPLERRSLEEEKEAA